MHRAPAGLLTLALVACNSDEAVSVGAPDAAKVLPEEASTAPPRPAPPPMATEVELPEHVAASVALSAEPLPATKHGFTLRARTDHFRIYSKMERDFERLAEVSEKTRSRIRFWLDAPPDGENGPVDIFLVEARAEIRDLEGAIGMSQRRNSIRRRSGGGYYHDYRTVLLEVSPAKNLEWMVSHEVCHSVFRANTRKLPAALNEGLAEVLPAWVLFFDDHVSPETVTYRYDSYASVCADLVDEDRVPELGRFFRQSFDEFQSDRWTHFALAWSLSRFLMTSDHEEIHGKLPSLMHELGEGVGAWDDFRSVYDAALVERLWHEELNAMAARQRRHR